MKTIGLAASALALSFALAPMSASALDYNCCDKNKDGMVSRAEYLDEMGKIYDEAMEKMKKMPAAEQAKMMKGDQMTLTGFEKFLKDNPGHNR
jgi:hypothetical protein